MQDKIETFKRHVREAAANPSFVHHKWFVRWHLEIVEQIANDLVQHYPEANRELVELMVWLHDYGKILDFNDQYAVTLTAGRKKLNELGFPADFVDTAITNIETLDKKLEVDLRQANIEIQIVSSADGCSHFVGPFMQLWWYEHPDKPIDELMADNLSKAEKDWNYKVTLPEARAAFQPRYEFKREQLGNVPQNFL